jgi:hypothetical protein
MKAFNEKRRRESLDSALKKIGNDGHTITHSLLATKKKSDTSKLANKVEVPRKTRKVAVFVDTRKSHKPTSNNNVGSKLVCEKPDAVVASNQPHSSFTKEHIELEGSKSNRTTGEYIFPGLKFKIFSLLIFFFLN